MFTEFNSYWWLIFFIPLLLWGGYIFIKQKNKQLKTPFFYHNQNFKPIPNIWFIKSLLVFLGICFLLLSVWRPKWGHNLEKTEKKGLDIIFTVDVSKSMKALDFSQGRHLISRLDATKYLIENFIKNQKSDRIGLIEFAGESFVASPLTLDHTVFLNFLKNISSDDLGKQGTNFAEALEISIARLEILSTEKRGKMIILFSDGDETISSNTKIIAQQAKEKGIKIYTIGIGSKDRIPIPEGETVFGEIVYKKWKGETVFTSLNEEPLKKIASITNGEYFHVEKLNDLDQLVKKLKKIPKKILEEDSLTPSSEKYFIFTFFGLILFVSGFLFPQNNIFKK